MKALKFLAVLVAISGVLVIHEAGHALAMFDRGIPVETFSLGFDLGIMPQFKFQIQRFPGTTFKVSPILFGAYVAPSQEGVEMIKRLPLADRVFILGNGIRYNIILAGILLLIVLLTGKIDGRKMKRAIVIAGITLFVLFLPNAFCIFVIPAAGMIALVWVLGHMDQLGGPISAFRSMFGETKPRDLAWAVGFLSANVGIANMIPAVPMDGGKIVCAYIATGSPVIANRVETIGLIFFFAMIMKALLADMHPRKK